MRPLHRFSILLTVCFLGLFSSCEPDCLLVSDPPAPKILSYDVVKAWDISTYAAWKDQLPSFFDSAGTPINIFNFMHKAGVNTLRLRIIHGKPSFPHPTLEQLLWIAKIAHQQKIALWLDFHYSDDWADPGHQATPNDWKNLSIQALSDTIQQYTYSTVAKFCAQIQPLPSYKLAMKLAQACYGRWGITRAPNHRPKTRQPFSMLEQKAVKRHRQIPKSCFILSLMPVC